MRCDVAAIGDLPGGEGVQVEAGGEPVLLVRVGDHVYATSGLCSHEERPLLGGTRIGDTEWQCPHHGGALDLATGRPTRMPVCAPVATYPVEVRDGRVWVTVD